MVWQRFVLPIVIEEELQLVIGLRALVHRKAEANAFVAIDAITLGCDIVKQALRVLVVDKSKVANLTSLIAKYGTLCDKERLHLLNDRSDDCVLLAHDSDVRTARQF